MTNEDIARQLRRHAAALAKGGDNLYRVRAFRQAAMAVLTLPEPVDAVLATRGRRGLEAVPGIGKSLAETIESYARTGDWKPRPAA
jgi:DNA polymerase (family 10)